MPDGAAVSAGASAVLILVVLLFNFCVFSFGYILLAVFTDYLVCFIASRGFGISKFPARLMWGLSFTAIVLVIISQFNHMYYLIDDNNIYHRQNLFWLSQTFGIFCMLIDHGHYDGGRHFYKGPDA